MKEMIKLNKFNVMVLSIDDAVKQWHEIALAFTVEYNYMVHTVNTVHFSFSLTLEKLCKKQQMPEAEENLVAEF